MTDPDRTKASAAESDVLNHAWAWFALHAAQRMQAINYFLIGIALVVAGYGAAFAGGNYVVALAIGVLGAGLTYTFWALDRRTRQLIKAAEVPLREVQAELARRSGIESIRLLDAVETPEKLHLTYSRALSILMILVFVLMVVAIVTAAWGLGPAPHPVPAPVPSPTA